MSPRSTPPACSAAAESRALDDVSLSIAAGEVFGLIGPNRAGKTTLVKILLSICRPTAGRIMRLGPALARSQHAGPRRLRPRKPGLSALSDGPRAVGILRALVAGSRPAVVRRRGDELLERVGLADRSHEPIGRFSKGMLQRLALAQALVNDPELLVLDEPSEGMDLAARRLLARRHPRAASSKDTRRSSSRMLADVERLCDRVAVLRGGRVAFLGRVAELQG